ncbi:phosphoribosyltransferase [Neisseria gonorrhoeae]
MNEDKGLVAKAVAAETEQEELFESRQVIEETFAGVLNTYVLEKTDVLEKTEQVERIEEKLEQLISGQMAKLQALQNARPGMLSMPSKKQTWSANIAVAQSRLNRLHDRLEDVREIRDGMALGVPKIQELAARKLRMEEPDLAKKFDDVQTAVRVHNLHEKQRKEKEQQKRQAGLSLSLGQKIVR